MKKLLFPLLLLLGGCSTYGLTLAPNGPGELAHGTAHEASRRISISLDGQTFAGHFSYVNGGSLGVANAWGSVGGMPAIASGEGFGFSLSGVGQAILHSAQGNNLVCVFSYSQISHNGYGRCRLNGEKTYMLTIRRTSPF